MPPASKRLRILFTEGSSISAREALYCLGKRHTIDVLDPSRTCQCRFSRFVRRWYRCPSFSREPMAYLAFLMEKVRSGNYDVLLPTHEQVYLLSRVRDTVRRHVGLAVPEFDSMDRMMSKAHFIRTLQELGMDHPESCIVRTREEMLASAQTPCYAKLDYGTAGVGVRFIADQDSLLRVTDEFDQAGLFDGVCEIVLQQPAGGAKRAAMGVFQNGRLTLAHSWEGRALGVGGSSCARTNVADPVMHDVLKRLGGHLNWHGAMTLEYFYDESTGRRLMFECNPRFCETIPALLDGVNICEQMLRVSLDEPAPDLTAPIESANPHRSHQTYLSLVAKAMNGGNRKAIAAELWQALRGQGVYAGGTDELTRPREDWLSLVPFLSITTALFVSPALGQRLVSKTVENYCLHQDAARRIRELSDAELAAVV
jgi:predicted ATP-grasp superfamily ATP-dependent carboligase